MAVLPLLSILAMSPSQVESKFAKRGIASVVEPEAQVVVALPPEVVVEPKQEVVVATPTEIFEALQPKVQEKEKIEKHPKLKEITSKTDTEQLYIDPNLDSAKLKIKRDELKVNLLKAKEDFKKGLKDEKLVEQQRREVEDLVVQLLLVEGGLKELQRDEKVHDSEVEETNKLVSEAQDILEGLIVELKANEELVSSSKKEDVVEVASVKEKKATVPVAKEEESSAEETNQSNKEEEAVVCDHDKNQVLTEQLDNLLAQQNKVLAQLLNMSQMMSMQTMMFQQQMMSQQMGQFNSLGTRTPYQYASETAAGNWVYYPGGTSQGQANIFSPQVGSGYYPDQTHQSSWNLRPQMSFENRPSFGAQAPQNGNFGMNSFNFENQAPVAQPYPVASYK